MLMLTNFHCVSVSGPDDKGCDSAGVDAGGDRAAQPHAQDGTGKDHTISLSQIPN